MIYRCETVVTTLGPLVAILLAGVLALACSAEPATPTGAPVSQATIPPLVNPTPLPVRTATPMPAPTATENPTSTPAPTNTARPTDTPTPDPTNTPMPTSTPTPFPTATTEPVPTSTPEPTATPTSTPVPPPTREPTPTPVPYYTQFVDVDGIPVKASMDVGPEALEIAAGILDSMLGHRPDIVQRMVDQGASLAIIPKDGYITEIPELNYLQGRLDPNGNPYDSFRVRGAGGIRGQTTTVTSEENLLGLEEDRTRFWAEDITVHEWAHAMENLGFDTATKRKWRDLFDRAREADLWPGTFAMAVDGGRELFAELTQSYFEVNNEIGGRREIGENAEEGLLAAIFEALQDVYGSARPVNRLGN